jgi:hypothetical protein
VASGVAEPMLNAYTVSGLMWPAASRLTTYSRSRPPEVGSAGAGGGGVMVSVALAPAATPIWVVGGSVHP